MKKILIFIAILLAIVVVGLIAQNHFKTRSKTPTATINNHTFKLELAKTQKEKEIGLSNKKSLGKDAGMLFLFEKPDYYSFWMRNMRFSIDIIYIKDNRIVTIHKNVKPPKDANENLLVYNSSQPADKVLEIDAGLSEKYNFKEGDIVKLKGL